MSKFLMGALVVLTMGVFSSCKDYDDDINANTALINGLQSQVSALESAKSTLQADLSKANSAIQAAQAAADKAAADLAQAKIDLQNASNAAKTEVNGNIDAAKKAAIDEAQARIDAAEGRIKAYALEVAQNEAAAAAAAAKIEMLNQLNNEVATLNAAINTKLSTEEFNTILATLATKEGLNEALKPVLAEISALQGLVATKADQSTVDAIQTRLNEIAGDYVKKGDFETAIALLGARLDAIDGENGALNKLTASVNKNAEDISVNSAAISGLQQAVNQIQINYATIEYVDSKINTLDEKLSTEIAKMALKTDLQALQQKVDDALAQYATDKDILTETIAYISTTILEIQQNYATTADLNSAVGEITTALQNLAASLQNYYTKGEADDAIAAAVGAAKLDLQLQINDLTGDISNLQDAIRVLNEVTLVKMNEDLLYEIGLVDQKVDDSVETLMGIIADLASTDYVDGKIEALKTAMSGIYATQSSVFDLDGRVGTIEGELAGMAAALNELATELGALTELPDVSGSRLKVGATASSGITALVNLLKTMSEKITEVYDYLDAIGVQISDMEGAFDSKINGVYSFFNTAIAGVNTKINNITLFITKNLTSLVYRPEVDGVGESSDVAYLYGFPVIRAILLQPQKVYTFKYTAATATAGDKDVATGSGSVSKQFDIVAKYWLNPSSTDISKYKFGFDEVVGKNIITRGNKDTKKAGVGAKVIGVDKKGVLSVALTLNDGANVNDALTYDEGAGKAAWITTVALQAVRNDADVATKDTVTSDYAIIVPAYYKDLLLANNKYEKNTHIQGNREFHLRTVYDELKNENATGSFSYELAYNDDKAVVDLTTIDVHFDNGTPDAGVMTHKDAEDRGFTFKYTILTDKDYFTLDADKQQITVAKKENTSVGKIANVRVELQADGKTFAYGYISIIITSPKVKVTIEMPDLIIKCPDPVKTGLKWADVKKKIEDAIGVTGALANYNWDGVVTDLNKFTTESVKQKDNKKGKIVVDEAGNVFNWTFTEAEIESVFYSTLMKPAPKEYSTWIHLTPKAGHPELSEVVINVKILNEVYPTGEFSYTQRIQQYWFNKESVTIAETPENRYEIHGNVEVVDQPSADDEFFFNIAASFFNSKFGQSGYDDVNQILIYDTKKFGYADLATVYFDAEKYYIYKASDANKTIAQMKSIAPATSFAKGMSGTEYLLYIADIDSKVLMAVPNKLDVTKAQPVVELSATYNNVATFQGWTYFTGLTKDADGKIIAGNALDFAYAYDLLNKNDHNEVGAGETFTTHMMLDKRDYCFPIDFSANESFKFDIRWLRPISVDEQQDHTITDAVDAGTIIKLAQYAGFVDWRDIKFSATNKLNYINYYGIRAIKPNLDKTVTDINGGWTLIKYFPLLQFEDLTTEGSGTYSSAADFINSLGYVKYTNNGLNVGTFTIKMPITLLYDWGETAEQTITFTIKRTQGQDITARMK